MRKGPCVPRVLYLTFGCCRPTRLNLPYDPLFYPRRILIISLRQINHHLETIAQIREEATQWKNQCLRLEETSRQEAVSWKEQFLRVEQERSKLSRRVEELVAEQLSSVCSFDSNCMPGSLSTRPEWTCPNVYRTTYSHGEVFGSRRFVRVYSITARLCDRFIESKSP